MGRVVWVCAAVLWGAWASGAELEATARVRAEVMREGVPVPEATVRIGARTYKTDGEGRAVFDVPSGAAKVEVSAEGMEPETTAVAVRPGEDAWAPLEGRTINGGLRLRF